MAAQALKDEKSFDAILELFLEAGSAPQPPAPFLKHTRSHTHTHTHTHTSCPAASHTLIPLPSPTCLPAAPACIRILVRIGLTASVMMCLFLLPFAASNLISGYATLYVLFSCSPPSSFLSACLPASRPTASLSPWGLQQHQASRPSAGKKLTPPPPPLTPQTLPGTLTAPPDPEECESQRRTPLRHRFNAGGHALQDWRGARRQLLRGPLKVEK